jgi:hypothetical protein
LQRDPENRPSAKILLEHSFFNINSQKVSDNNIGLNLEIPRNLNSPSKIRNDTKSLTHTKNMIDIKLIDCKNFHIEVKTEAQQETVKNESTLNNKNVVNILATSENNGGACFSISMTISQQSEIPQDVTLNKESKIIPLNLTEKDNSINSKNQTLKKLGNDTNNLKNELGISNDQNNSKNIKKEESEKFNFIDQSSITIKNFLENCNNNKSEIYGFENKEKFNTLDLRNEDMNNYQNHFKVNA